MSTRHILPYGFFVLAIASLAFAAPPEPAAKPTAEELVKDLGSPVYVVRERASRELWAMGAKAADALRAGSRSDDPEVSRRSREILAKFDAGIFPNTPPDVLKLIKDFRTGTPEKQHPAVTALVRLGAKGVPALRSLLVQEQPAETRGPLFDHLSGVLRQEVPKALAAGKPELAEDLLALNVFGPSNQGLTDYVLLLKLRGRTSAPVADLEAARKGSGAGASAAARALVFLYKAAGERVKAKALASELADTDPTFRSVYESLLEDYGAWSELADRAAQDSGVANSREGLTLFRLRQAGRAKEADELADQQKEADVGDRGRYGAVDEATMALMLGERPLDGIERMKAKRNLPHILADVMAARMEFTAALDLLKTSDAAKAADEANGYDTQTIANLYGTRKGRLLAQLGHRDAAVQVFSKLAEQVTGANRDDYSLTQLLRAEMRSGRYDLACEHLGKAQSGGVDGEEPIGRRGYANRLDPFEAVFEADAESAQFWWKVLRPLYKQTESPGLTMRRVRALLTGSALAADLTAAVKAADREFGVTPESMQGQVRAMAVATAYRTVGLIDEAIAALVEPVNKLAATEEADAEAQTARRYGRGSRSWVFGTDERIRLWIELGDLLMEQGKHREAATRYEQGWKQHPDNPLPYYLSGRALQKAGDEAEAKRRIELSHWIGLGNARVRGRFLEELVNRGAVADARRERDLILESGWLSELFIGNVWNQVARASVMFKDFDAAGAANRRAIHYLLRTPNVSYVEGYAYLTVPQAASVYKARNLLAAGKVAESLAVARESLVVLPGNSEVALGLVPGLDKLGRKKEADELFRQVWTTYGKLIADNPDSAWGRYSAAWLAAGCQRELDAALKHALKAVELEPGVKSNQEALAEVRFRRGERKEAVAAMKSLSSGDPRNFHYRRQLERYQTAAFDSPLPEEGND